MATQMRLLQLASGVLFFHVANSILQEAVFMLPSFRYTVLLSSMQAVLLSLFGFLDTRGMRKTPLRVYAVLACLSAAGIMLTNEASRLLNYPTQVVFKSSKLVFVMTLRLLVIGRRARSHSILRDYTAGSIIVLGLVAFTYATASSTHEDSGSKSIHDVLRGTVAIVSALVCDAMLYIGEEKYCFAQYQAPPGEVITWTNAFSAVYSVVFLLMSGNAGESVHYAVVRQPAMTVLVVVYSCCNYGGTRCLLSIVAQFDSNVAVMVTSGRKLSTVLLSYVVYPKPFGILHAIGVLAVGGGIALHEMGATDHKKNADESVA